MFALSSCVAMNPCIICELQDEEAMEWNLFQLYHSGKMPDLSIVVGHRLFKVHIPTLTQRCPGLAEALTPKIVRNLAVADETDERIFDEFLRYVYSAKDAAKPLNFERTLGLIILAIKYDVQQLYVDCLRYFLDHGSELIYRMDVDNVLQIMICADFIQNDIAKREAAKYILVHVREVMCHPYWLTFCQRTDLVQYVQYIDTYITADEPDTN